MDDGVIRFGDVQIDPVRGRLSRGGRRIDLDRSTSAILTLLAREAGSEVAKDRLLEAGWPGRVVHENSLAKAIGRLRQGLGGDADALQTIHGYGYRLDTDAAAPRPHAVPAASRAASSPMKRLALALPAAALLALGAILLAQHLEGTGAVTQRLTKGEAADSIGRVLWVDDNPQNNGAERRFLERNKIAVYQVTTTEEALQLLAMYEYGAVISDMNRNDKPLDGLALVREMRRRDDRTPFILYSVVPSEAQRLSVAQAGGQAATVTSRELYEAVLPLFRRS
jgi:DNA-binding response OmpR family regulator